MSKVTIDLKGKKYHFDTKEYQVLSEWFAKKEKELSDFIFYGVAPAEQPEEESFYFVLLKNTDKSLPGTMGKKSRLTGKIFLIDQDYEPDLTKPIEETSFEYFRDATSMDL